MEKVIKKIGLALLIILLIACTIVNVWYILIKQYGSSKTAYSNFYMDTLEKADGEKKNIMEIKYFSNRNQNGLECFDLKLNSFIDDTRENTETVGLQYVANSKDDSLNWVDGKGENIQAAWKKVYDKDVSSVDNLTAYKMKTTRKNFWHADYYNLYYGIVNSSSFSKYSYFSVDDQDFTAAPLKFNKNSKFLLEYNKGSERQLIGLKLKFDNYLTYDESFENQAVNCIGTVSEPNLTVLEGLYCRFYYNYNFNFLSWYLYQKVKEIPAGTQYSTFKFGDFFKYYDVKNGVWTEKFNQDYELIQEEINTYFTIKIEVLEDGIRQSSDSAFKLLHGTSNYKLDDTVGGEYFAGKEIIDLDTYAFDLVQVEGNLYLLKLKEEVYNAYISKKNLICFKITIDTAILRKEGKVYVGFEKNSGLDEFEICSTNIEDSEVFL